MPQFDFFNIFLTFFTFFFSFTLIETLTIYVVKGLVVSKFYLLTLEQLSKQFSILLKN